MCIQQSCSTSAIYYLIAPSRVSVHLLRLSRVNIRKEQSILSELNPYQRQCRSSAATVGCISYLGLGTSPPQFHRKLVLWRRNNVIKNPAKTGSHLNTGGSSVCH
eukprot:g5021.t1